MVLVVVVVIVVVVVVVVLLLLLLLLIVFFVLVFTALHLMQTRYCDENSVCPSVCLSHACIVTKR